MENNNKNINQEFNEPFDQWVREVGPSVPDCSREKDEFLTGFRKKMHADQRAKKIRTRKNIKRSATVMSVVVLCVLAFSFNDVGSDGFDVVLLEDAMGSGKHYKSEFLGDGFGLPSYATEQDAIDFNQMLAAGGGVIVEAQGWVTEDIQNWTVIREYRDSGQVKRAGNTPVDPPSHMDREHVKFILGEGAILEGQIERGELLPTGTITKKIDGVIFALKTWQIETETSGTVYFFKGPPIR